MKSRDYNEQKLALQIESQLSGQLKKVRKMLGVREKEIALKYFI